MSHAILHRVLLDPFLQGRVDGSSLLRDPVVGADDDGDILDAEPAGEELRRRLVLLATVDTCLKKGLAILNQFCGCLIQHQRLVLPQVEPGEQGLLHSLAIAHLRKAIGLSASNKIQHVVPSAATRRFHR